MRTTFKDLQSVTEILRNLSGINYRAFGESGAYFVGVKHEDTSIGEIVVRGALKECNIAVRAVLNAYHYQKRQEPAPDGPQFIAVITDGMLQSIISLTGKPISYLLIDEDAILIQAEEGGLELIGNLTNNEILKGEVTKGLENGEFFRESDLTLSNRTASTIVNALGYNLKN